LTPAAVAGAVLMEIAVVIVNYNTRDLLARCLASLHAAQLPDQARCRIVVVDNASQDGSAELPTAPDTTLLASPVNLGFTGGNNLALAALGFPVRPPSDVQHLAASLCPAPPDYVLLLNPDTEVIPNALLCLVEFMQATPHAAVCGAHLCYGDGAFQHAAFRFPGLFQVALDLFPLHGLPFAHRLYDSVLNGRYARRLWQGDTPFPVDFVLGAAMLLRGQAIHHIGGLDDDFFMYCEEMDWCLRCAEAGLGVYAHPGAHVIHHEAQSSRQNRSLAFERLWRSRYRFYAKYPRRYPAGFRLVLRVLVRAAMAWRSQETRRRFAQGRITGRDAAQELAAYATLRTL
jgi:N-acetylglucosaminyl-diphospho-decaprenol L-rhamnosyltransferase